MAYIWFIYVIIYTCNCMEQKKARLLFTVTGPLESLNLLNYIQFFTPGTDYVNSFFWLQN